MSTTLPLVCVMILPFLIELKTSSEAVGEDALKFLGVLKMEKPGSGNIAASANEVQKAIRQLERLAGVGLVVYLQLLFSIAVNVIKVTARLEEDSPETLGGLVDEEMAATSEAVEAAALRIQEMLKKSREDDTGVKLEVNERILDSCTELMKAIKILILRSKELQNEIVKEGMVSLERFALTQSILTHMHTSLRESHPIQTSFTRRTRVGQKD